MGTKPIKVSSVTFTDKEKEMASNAIFQIICMNGVAVDQAHEFFDKLEDEGLLRYDLKHLASQTEKLINSLYKTTNGMFNTPSRARFVTADLCSQFTRETELDVWKLRNVILMQYQRAKCPKPNLYAQMLTACVLADTACQAIDESMKIFAESIQASRGVVASCAAFLMPFKRDTEAFTARLKDTAMLFERKQGWNDPVDVNKNQDVQNGVLALLNRLCDPQLIDRMVSTVREQNPDFYK